MKNLNWVVAAKRLYLAVWAIGTFLVLIAASLNGSLTLGNLIPLILTVLVIPLSVYKAAQWIYAGLTNNE